MYRIVICESYASRAFHITFSKLLEDAETVF